MYKGTLWFEDGDEIVVNALIPHGDRISFDFTATWGEHGQWRREGSAVRVGNVFISEIKPSKHALTGIIGLKCRVSITAKKRTPLELEVKGNWEEQGESYAFGGVLEGNKGARDNS